MLNVTQILQINFHSFQGFLCHQKKKTSAVNILLKRFKVNVPVFVFIGVSQVCAHVHVPLSGDTQQSGFTSESHYTFTTPQTNPAF